MRLLKSTKPEERAVAEKIGVVFPNQGDRGTHVNISGAGVLKNAPHREAAVKFLEYLASPEAQAYFANGNNEYPVAGTVRTTGARRSATSKDSSTSRCSAQPGVAQQIYDRAGWK